MIFDFYNPVKMITGERCVEKNAEEFLKLGKSCLLVTGGSSAKKSGALGDVTAALDRLGIRYMIFDGIEQNPSAVSCHKAGRLAAENGLEFVVGIGGGSPLDASKAAAVYAANDMDCMDIYNMAWPNPALPIAAVGTTAGTGSEVTCFSILTMANGRKKAFGTEQTYPRVMFGDARYTATLPLRFTASTAMDALSHAVEAYFSSASNSMTDIYAIQAVKLLCPQLRLLQNAKSDADITPEQREKLYFASIVAGVALSQCGTLYCHTLGYYFTEEYGVPHGFACGATLCDLVERGVKYLPDKANRLFSEAQTDAGELCSIIAEITEMPEITMTNDEILRLARDGAGNKNFVRTPPNGLSAEGAQEILKRLFG